MAHRASEGSRQAAGGHRLGSGLDGYVSGMANMDDIKGKAKEAAGTVTGDKDLEREGKVDRAAGSVKENVSNATDKVKEVLHKD